MKVRPALASSWENPDSQTWIFHLNSAARFHSGKPVRASDVVYTFRRLISTETLEIRAFISAVEDVTALDSENVKIRTRKPMSFFLNNLNFVHILPEGAEKSNLSETVDGTGPYRLVRHPDEGRIQMVRNEE